MTMKLKRFYNLENCKDKLWSLCEMQLFSLGHHLYLVDTQSRKVSSIQILSSLRSKLVLPVIANYFLHISRRDVMKQKRKEILHNVSKLLGASQIENTEKLIKWRYWKSCWNAKELVKVNRGYIIGKNN